MNRRVITTEEILQTLRAVVAENPDFVYEAPRNPSSGERLVSCVYAVQDGETLAASCGVGHVFHRLDPELLAFAHQYDIEQPRTRMFGSSPKAVARDMTLELGVIIEENGLSILHHFQVAQDNRTPWSESLNKAEFEVLP